MRITLVVLLSAFLVACSNEPIVLGNKVVTVSESGGCEQVGPNCLTYVLYDNEYIEIYRQGVDLTTPEATIEASPEFTSIWTEALVTDFEQLKETLGEEGHSESVDFKVTYYPVSGPVTFDSTIHELHDNEVFSVVEDIQREVVAQGHEIPVLEG